MNDQELIALAKQNKQDPVSIIIADLADKLLWRRTEIETKATSIESMAKEIRIDSSSSYSLEPIANDIDRLVLECRMLEQVLKDLVRYVER